jgi:hypothetical protein
MAEINEFYSAVQTFRRKLLKCLKKTDKALVEVSFSVGPDWLVTIKRNVDKKKP